MFKIKVIYCLMSKIYKENYYRELKYGLKEINFLYFFL